MNQAPRPPRPAPLQRRSIETRQSLIDAARDLFVEQGYHATGTEEIVALAGAGTRGALYHHFPDKLALFEAVYRAIEAEVTEDLTARVRSVEGRPPLERLRVGLLGLLDAAATRPDVRRVLLVEGPAVLGRRRWRDLEVEFGLDSIRRQLQGAIADGTMAERPIDVLAHTLLAAVDEAALFVAEATDRSVARAEAIGAIETLLTGLGDRTLSQRGTGSP